MTAGLAAMLAGVFGVPLVLLWMGHRIRRRPPAWRGAFWGAAIAHIAIAPVAMIAAMSPAAEWAPTDTMRGALGFWSLLLVPIAGAVIGTLVGARTTERLVVLALLGPLSAGFGPPAKAQSQPQGHGLIGVVGRWTSIDDGGPAIQADGERWSGQTTRAQLEEVRASLFPTLTESFVSNATAGGAFPLAVFGGVRDFAEGTIRVRFKLVGGKSDQTAGIVLGLQPTGEYLFVRYNTKDGNVAVWRYANGTREVLAHGGAHAQLPLGAWHELVVNVSGTTVTGEVVGRGLEVEHAVERPPAGRVGLWTKRDAVTAFKEFRVTR